MTNCSDDTFYAGGIKIRNYGAEVIPPEDVTNVDGVLRIKDAGLPNYPSVVTEATWASMLHDYMELNGRRIGREMTAENATQNLHYNFISVNDVPKGALLSIGSQVHSPVLVSFDPKATLGRKARGRFTPDTWMPPEGVGVPTSDPRYDQILADKRLAYTRAALSTLVTDPKESKKYAAKVVGYFMTHAGTKERAVALLNTNLARYVDISDTLAAISTDSEAWETFATDLTAYVVKTPGPDYITSAEVLRAALLVHALAAHIGGYADSLPDTAMTIAALERARVVFAATDVDYSLPRFAESTSADAVLAAGIHLLTERPAVESAA